MTGTTSVVLPAHDYALLAQHGYTGLETLQEMQRLLPFIDTMTMRSDTHWVRLLEVPNADLMDDDGIPQADLAEKLLQALDRLRDRWGGNAVRTVLTRQDTYRIMLAIAPCMSASELREVADQLDFWQLFGLAAIL